jgi:hypothetical protein
LAFGLSRVSKNSISIQKKGGAPFGGPFHTHTHTHTRARARHLLFGVGVFWACRLWCLRVSAPSTAASRVDCPESSVLVLFDLSTVIIYSGYRTPPSYLKLRPFEEPGLLSRQQCAPGAPSCALGGAWWHRVCPRAPYKISWNLHHCQAF